MQFYGDPACVSACLHKIHYLCVGASLGVGVFTAAVCAARVRALMINGLWCMQVKAY